MKQYKVTIKLKRLGVGDEYKTNVVTAVSFKKALEKTEFKIMAPLRTAAEGKNVLYEITAIELIERGNNHADDD